MKSPFSVLWESAAAVRDDRGWKPLPQERHFITAQDGAARHNLLFTSSSKPRNADHGLRRRFSTAC